MTYSVIVNNNAITVNLATTSVNVTIAGVGPQGPAGVSGDGSHALLTDNPHSVTKTQVGLANVDNTSDANKPVSTAQQTALNLKANLDSPTFTGPVNGITAAMVGLGNVNNTSDANKPVSTAQSTAISLKLDATHAGTGGASHADVVASGASGFMTGADKTKLDGVATGANNYVHPTGDGNLHVPATGTSNNGKVLTAGATEGSLSWTAVAGGGGGTVTGVTATTPVASSGGTAPVISMAAATGSVDGYLTAANFTAFSGKQSALGFTPENSANKGAASGYASLDATSKVPTAQLPTLVKADVGLGNVDNTSDSNKPVSTAQSTAIGLKLDATHAGSGGVAHADVVASGASGFMTGADKTKLDGVATGANNYSHPSDHPPSIITQDASNRFVTDAEKTTWNSKGDVTLAGTQTLTNKTLTGYTETEYGLAGTDLAVSNGTIQYKTLSGNTTFTESLANGQGITLMLNPATFTATWPTTTWIGTVASTAPTLIASVYNCIVFFQMNGTLYGRYIGRI